MPEKSGVLRQGEFFYADMAAFAGLMASRYNVKFAGWRSVDNAKIICVVWLMIRRRSWVSAALSFAARVG